MTSEALKLHAAKAADEIERRGWVRGSYAEEWVCNPDFDEATWSASWSDDLKDYTYQIPDELQIPLADCRVCLLGGLGASYFGNPNAGHTQDGNGYDDLVGELADHVHPGWRDETIITRIWPDGEKGLRPRWSRRVVDEVTREGTWKLSPHDAVTNWNDEDATDGAEVVAKLREIAAS